MCIKTELNHVESRNLPNHLKYIRNEPASGMCDYQMQKTSKTLNETNVGCVIQCSTRAAILKPKSRLGTSATRGTKKKQKHVQISDAGWLSKSGISLSKHCIVALYFLLLCICPELTAAQCSSAGIQKNTAVGVSCLCTSRYYGTSCESQNVEVACDNTPNYYTIGNDAAIANTIVSGQSVDILVRLPMSDGRTYTSVSVESCAETSFQALVWSSDVFPACDDLVTISINIADLEGVCTFSQSDVIESNTLYRQYRGSVVVVYSESVPVTSGSSTTRTSTFTLPIDIKLQGNVAATTTTTTDVAVFSAFDLQAAISGLVISDGAPTSLVYISYGLPYPYSVTSFNPTLTLSGGTLVQSAVVTSPVSAERCNHAGATEYSYANNVCFKTLGIDITHGSSCTLDGIYTINTVGVNCGDNVPASDCPLAAEDTSSSVSFTLVSENFCDGMGLNAIIDDAVTIAEFTTFHEEDVQSGTPTTQRAFLFGEDVWFKMSFVGLKIFSVAMDSLVTDLNANDHKFTMVDAGTNLGFDVETQLYWFKHEITESFVGADPGPGNSQSAVVTVTITTSYEEPVRRRRRRRRAVSRSSQDMVNEGTHNERDKNRIHVGRARGRRISFDDLKPNNPGVYEPIDGEDILDDVPVKQNSIQDNVGEVVEMNEETKDTNEDVYDTLDLKPNDVVGATTTATPSSTKEPPTKSDTTPTPSGSGTTEPDGNADTAERQSKNTTPTPSPLVLTPNIPTGSSFVEVEKGEVVVEKVQTGEIDETGGDSTGNSTEKGIADGSVFVIRGDEDVEFVFHNNVPLGTSPTPKPEVTTTVSESDVDNDDLYGAGDKLVETGQGSVSTQFKFEGVIGKPLVWDTDISPGASITQGEQIVLRKRRSTDQMRKRRLRGQINI